MLFSPNPTWSKYSSNKHLDYDTKVIFWDSPWKLCGSLFVHNMVPIGQGGLGLESGIWGDGYSCQNKEKMLFTYEKKRKVLAFSQNKIHLISHHEMLYI